jgi:osmotically-inducible protein OsmY
MNRYGAKRIIGAMLYAAIASCVTEASAQSAANASAGVAVQRVSASTPGTRPDSSIVRDVRRALQRVPEMDDSKIHIRVSLGVVTLTGTVPETWQISRAGNAARAVLGVKSVRNRLTVPKEKEDGAASE